MRRIVVIIGLTLVLSPFFSIPGSMEVVDPLEPITMDAIPNPIPELNGVLLLTNEISMEEGTDPFGLVWRIKQDQVDPGLGFDYYVNDVITDSGDDLADKKIDINLIAFTTGSYNLTIEIFNNEGTGINSVFLEVYPTQAPNIIPLIANGSEYEIDKLENYLKWNVSDVDIVDIKLYEEFRGIPKLIQDISYPSVTTNVQINTTTDLLKEIGDYNFTIVVTDHLGLVSTNTSSITVIENQAPIITDKPGDLIYTFDVTGNNLTWVVDDVSGDYYEVFNNSQYLLNATWTSGSPIILDIDGLSIGIYNFTIVFYDSELKFVTDTVFVEVLAFDTNIPILTLTQSMTVGFEEIISGNWTDGDGSPMEGSNVLAQLLNDLGSTVYNFTLELDQLGEFTQLLNYTNISSGNYTWKFTYSKEGYIIRIFDIPIKITSQEVFLSIEIDEKFVQNEIFSINATLSNQLNLLSLDVLPSFEGIEVKFILAVIYSDDSVGSITRTVLTDANGVAHFILSPKETKLVFDLTSLSVELVDDSFITANSVMIDDVSLPVVDLIITQTTPGTTPTDDTSTPSTDLTTSAPEEFNFLPILYVLAIILLISMVIALIKKEDLKVYFNKQHQVNRKEFQYLKSLRRVILRTSSGLPIFERNPENADVDSNLISGITTAISSFLGEIEGMSSSGFEVVKRANLVITSHRSETSTLIVMSTQEMDQNILDILAKSHFDIDNELVLSEFITKIERGIITRELLISLDTIFTKIFSSNGIRMELLSRLMINNESFDELLETSAINGKIKTLILMLKEFKPPNNNFIMDDILDFYSKNEISDILSVSALFAAFEMGIITQVYY